MKFDNVSKNGDHGLEDTPENAFDKELIALIGDACEPEMLRDIILLKYFSTEQG